MNGEEGVTVDVILPMEKAGDDRAPPPWRKSWAFPLPHQGIAAGEGIH
ncbi:MAG: hypothetical protein ACLT8E_00960 [Akkermansia sp.]